MTTVVRVRQPFTVLSMSNSRGSRSESKRLRGTFCGNVYPILSYSAARSSHEPLFKSAQATEREEEQERKRGRH